jgi:hypothetical protein
MTATEHIAPPADDSRPAWAETVTPWTEHRAVWERTVTGIREGARVRQRQEWFDGLLFHLEAEVIERAPSCPGWCQTHLYDTIADTLISHEGDLDPGVAGHDLDLRLEYNPEPAPAEPSVPYVHLDATDCCLTAAEAARFAVAVLRAAAIVEPGIAAQQLAAAMARRENDR